LYSLLSIVSSHRHKAPLIRSRPTALYKSVIEWIECVRPQLSVCASVSYWDSEV